MKRHLVSLPFIICHLSFCVVLFTACAEHDEDGASLPTGDVAVSFTTVLEGDDGWADPDEARATRSTAGPINSLNDLKALTDGFGVFAYFTDEFKWGQTTLGVPTGGVPIAAAGGSQLFFMQNQNVYWPKDVAGNPVSAGTNANWTYEPPKYWPNYSNNDISEARYISFFAYAPYQTEAQVAANATTGGITTINVTKTANSVPSVTYKLNTTPGSQTDLLWANCANATRNGQGLVTLSGDDKVYQRVPLIFHHALASADIYVQRIYDGISTTNDNQLVSGKESYDTKIFIGSLQLASTDAKIEGTLSLEDGTWSNYSSTPLTFTFDSSNMMNWVSGSINANDANDAEPVRVYELDKWDYLWNDDGTRWHDDGTTEAAVRKANAWPSGVTEKPRRLNPASHQLLLLPAGSGVTLTPTVTYSFVTRDDGLQNGYLQDTQGAAGNNSRRYYRLLHSNITGNSIKLNVESGKHYTLLLHIGVEHVTFEVVSVEDWDFPLLFTPTTVEESDHKTTITHIVNEEP